ncbi:hypothetical protein QN382_12490 [Pseudomonas sp. 10B1]|uniref:hypothetical protein n=1 Tax=unclassified Pseudomonas TaxID=196821 RepID=UPI002B22F8F2|nr:MULTISPECIES: hypothetical protein [unclassified Pseudomonas]MEA9996303.1 hypothetical protein [Pseudomonas sp. AA4]MEB0086655.1 hypothetical protein [Pseudomonas sp. RTI1]MEB0124705.1 hypothetical protein [Pseudomonas sp. CCC1.2]MEB0154969.1 hypothetical protein [Pseudomonas sp. CCC4.3]MEB0217922.1 hypothetical protein [Pseudomonas sp. AB12(2023)]
MSAPMIAVSAVKAETAETYAAGYFIDALSRFIDNVSTEDPDLCDKALDAYVLGGLVAGLRIIGGGLMERCEEFTEKLEAMEASQ